MKKSSWIATRISPGDFEIIRQGLSLLQKTEGRQWKSLVGKDHGFDAHTHYQTSAHAQSLLAGRFSKEYLEIRERGL